MNVVGMISSGYDSGIIESAARSLKQACDTVYILDGPIAGSDAGEHTDLSWAEPNEGFRVRPFSVPFESDATKRTALLEWVKHTNGPDTWCVVLDSDELLLWGEYLRDFLALAEHRPITAARGFPLRLVEFDGSVALVSSRIYKLDAVKRYELSVHTIILEGSDTPIALPNQQVCYMHGNPMRPDDPRCRPPLQGEPHILHRTMLRNPTRQAQRQHEVEGEWFEQRKIHK
jgi:hypothetical protein